MPRSRLAFAAAIALNPALGSLYAWSIFLEPLEAALSVQRAELSVVFSVAVVFFTLGMTFGPAVYRVAATPILAATAALLCAAGLAITASASSLPMVIFGYGVLFGSGSGIGYSIMLQAVNLALPHRSGLANGIGIGLFAGGSILFAQVFGWSVAIYGVAITLSAMAGLFILIAALTAVLLSLSQVNLFVAAPLRAGDGDSNVSTGRLFWLLWTGFLLGASSGLMCVSQAAGIVTAYGGTLTLAVLGTTMVAVGNLTGRLAGGILSEYLPVRSVVIGAHAISVIGLVALIVVPSAIVAIAAICMAGVSYGLQTGTYPSAMAIFYGAKNFGRMMGRLITAWVIAGLAAPIIAGAVFDASGSYSAALWFAATTAALAMIVSAWLPGRGSEPRAV